MGFCLLKEYDSEKGYFAVNSSCVADLRLLDRKGPPACLLKLTCELPDFMPLAAGAMEGIQKILHDAAKIGVGKAEAQVLTGKRDMLKATPLLLNNPDRIALVREIPPEEFKSADGDFSTASIAYFTDGTTRLLAGRPGTFAMKVNAKGKVPVLSQALP